MRVLSERALSSSFLIFLAVFVLLAWTASAQDVAAPQPAAPVSEGHSQLPSPAKKLAKYDVTQIGERAIGKGVNFYSLERERALGREMAAEIETQSRLVTDPLVTEYVNRIGQSIVRNSDARVPFTIKVIDDDEVNAFALPGGYFYVDTGLIMAADNEAELAGVMAHEVAHVAARHATRNATRAQIWNMASIPLIFFGGPAGYALRQVAGLAVPMSFLKFSRDAEREADLLGVEYEFAAGYDPQSFVQFFEKLEAREKEKHSFLAKAFTTHPMNGDRIKRAQKAIATMLPPRTEYIVDTSEFQEVKSHLARVIDEHRSPYDNGRPVLKRRGPETKDGGNGPVLRKKTTTSNDYPRQLASSR
jgi:beta-barrel assembly-enhancing protease